MGNMSTRLDSTSQGTTHGRVSRKRAPVNPEKDQGDYEILKIFGAGVREAFEKQGKGAARDLILDAFNALP